MICFLLQNVGAAEALLRLKGTFGNDWFPVTVGYTIARCMFEVDLTAHYISVEPARRSSEYIKFGRVLDKRRLDACNRHRQSRNVSWRDGMELVWRSDLSIRAAEINTEYENVRHLYEATTKKNKKRQFQTWSGKTLRQIAIEVDHAEAYDVFYADLSSFAHADVRLADRFLRLRDGGLKWSARRATKMLAMSSDTPQPFSPASLNCLGNSSASGPIETLKNAGKRSQIIR